MERALEGSEISANVTDPPRWVRENFFYQERQAKADKECQPVTTMPYKHPTPRTDSVLGRDSGDSGLIYELATISRTLETENFHLAQLCRRALALLRQPADFKRWDEENDIRNALKNILYPNQNK